MKVLILSPHPDDMEWNMGGTVVKMKEKGWTVNQIIFSNCVELVGKKFIEGAKKSAKKLGVGTGFRNYLNQEFLNHRSEIREELFDLLPFEYDIIFVPCRQDWHQDHQVVTQEAVRVFRKNSTILGYIKDEIFERHHDLRVDLTDGQVFSRLKALKLFEVTEKPKNPEWFEIIQLRNYL